jgi:hypothetical protein
MGIKSTASKLGTYALGAVIMVALFALPVLFIIGGVAVAKKILPWLMFLSILTLLINIVVLSPLAAIRRTRAWAGVGFFLSSYVFGLTAWFMGLLLTWFLWGGFAVIIGLFIMGIGVVPIGMLATFLVPSHFTWVAQFYCSPAFP